MTAPASPGQRRGAAHLSPLPGQPDSRPGTACPGLAALEAGLHELVLRHITAAAPVPPPPTVPGQPDSHAARLPQPARGQQDSLALVTAYRRLREICEQADITAGQEARRSGASLAVLARAARISRQAAWERYPLTPPAPAAEPESAPAQHDQAPPGTGSQKQPSAPVSTASGQPPPAPQGPGRTARPGRQRRYSNAELDAYQLEHVPDDILTRRWRVIIADDVLGEVRPVPSDPRHWQAVASGHAICGIRRRASRRDAVIDLIEYLGIR
jgi:hypothetical protein